MTQLAKAKDGTATREMKRVARAEHIPLDKLIRGIAKGRIVIPANKKHKKLRAIGIGKPLSTKINANIGNSSFCSSRKSELAKLELCLAYGSDAVMDLSTGSGIDRIRQSIIENSPIPVGTVPIYQAVVEKGSIADLTETEILRSVEKHIKSGVDFITIHSGIRKKALPLTEKRLGGVVSRGGSFLVSWMRHNNLENPLYSAFDELLEMSYRHDCTLSLGDALRPGCLRDATDAAQLSELKALGKLAARANAAGVQAMIEGPGHVPLHQIRRNVELEKKYCNRAPFYVLGPLVTDIAPGYDHITAAIGGALAAYYGADFLCYVTPAEHLSLPDLADVKEGIIASRIAAHAADIAKGVPRARDWDDRMSACRQKLDWKGMFSLAIDRSKAESYRKKTKTASDTCTMCGKYCAVKIYNESAENKK
jgi:phosphomethylpyrimidine synthase